MFDPLFHFKSFVGLISLVVSFTVEDVYCCLFFTLCGARVMVFVGGGGRSSALRSIVAISSSAFFVVSPACRDGVAAEYGVVKMVMMSVAACRNHQG